MEFHFITLKGGGFPTITDPNNKSRYICFKSRRAAEECVSYLSEYRSEVGDWPVMNLAIPITKIEYNHRRTRLQSADQVRGYLEIYEKSREELDTMSANSGVSFFYCHDFEYKRGNFLSVNMRGQEVDGYVDDVMFINRLDYRLKTV